jgi:hypothetical protein
VARDTGTLVQRGAGCGPTGSAYLRRVHRRLLRIIDGRASRVIKLIKPMLRGWVAYFAVGNSSECFGFVKDRGPTAANRQPDGPASDAIAAIALVPSRHQGLPQLPRSRRSSPRSIAAFHNLNSKALA